MVQNNFKTMLVVNRFCLNIYKITKCNEEIILPNTMMKQHHNTTKNKHHKIQSKTVAIQ